MNDPGRKFYLTILLLVIFGLFVVLDKMTVDAYQEFALWALAIYSGANVTQKFVPSLRKQV